MPRSSRGRALMALSVAVASLSFAGSAHAALVQTAPYNVNGGSFDDHSIGGDDHLGWGNNGTLGRSDDEPLAVNFASDLQSTTSLRICGYNPSAVGGWMRAYETAGATCSGAAGAGNGWFRYVTANHSAAGEFNRWHLMDLQRFALVPVGAPAGRPIVWDNDWGTCIDATPASEVCELAPGAGSVAASLNAGQTKTTQFKGDNAPGSNSTPDATRIAIPSEARMAVDGDYQLVAIANPYNLYSGPSNVVCTALTLSGYNANPEAPVVTMGPSPASCLVPATLNPPLTGPTGRDPLFREAALTCGALIPATGHCWAAIPNGTGEPLAQTNATSASVLDPSGAVVSVPQHGALTQATTPAGITVKPAATAPVIAGASTRKAKVLTAVLSRSYSRTAARKAFGRRITRLSSVCRVTSASTSRCTVSFRKSGARYSGRMYIRFRTVTSRLRWQYRVDMTKKKSHHTTHVRRAYRTGGIA